MPGLDVSEILRQWDDGKEKDLERDDAREAVRSIRNRAEAAVRKDRAEELVDNNIGDPSLEHELRVAAGGGSSAAENAETQRLMNIARGKNQPPQPEPEKEDEGEYDKKPTVYEYQRRMAARLSNALAVRNVQKLIIINNRANLRKGLPGSRSRP